MRRSLRIRSALVVPALALGALSLPVLDLPGRSPSAAAVAEVPLDDPQAAVTAHERSDGSVVELRTIDADDDFSLVGVVWEDGADLTDTTVNIRTRDGADDDWGTWTALLPDQEGPDPGTEEAAQARAGTQSAWTGEATDLQVRTVRAADESVDGTSVVLVTPDEDQAVDTAPLASASAVTDRPALVTRAQWGADESRRTCDPSYSPSVKAAVVHHTADGNDYTAADVKRILQADYAFHTQSRGWCDIGYNALVDKFGTIYEGRAGGLDRAVIGAHASGFNASTFGVALIGNYDLVEPTAVSMESLARIIAWKLGNSYVDPTASTRLTSAGGTSRFAEGTTITMPAVFSHRDVGYTACPGQYVWKRMDALRSRVTALVGTQRSSLQSAWQSRGGAGDLGLVSIAEGSVPLATRTGFVRGDLYQSGYGTFAVRNAFRTTYDAMGGTSSVLGVPTAEERSAPGGGAVQTFSGNNGALYWSSRTGTQAVMGGIRDLWNAKGGPAGYLGYPTTPEFDAAGGQVARLSGFQGGDIYWSPAAGAHSVVNAIRDVYQGAGGSARLGVPTEEEVGISSTTVRQRFSTCSGVVYWSAASGAHAVQCAIADTYSAAGGPAASIGLPTGDEHATATGARQEFQRGAIEWDAATNTTKVVTP